MSQKLKDSQGAENFDYDSSTIWTHDLIKSAMDHSGSPWWSEDTMKCWGTRLLGKVEQGKGGVFFATSEKAFDGSRCYNVRGFDPRSLQIRSAATWVKSGVVAKKMAKELAGN